MNFRLNSDDLYKHYGDDEIWKTESAAMLDRAVEQLQEIPESNLDLRTISGELGKVETVKINRMESTPANGLQFVTALKSRSV